MPTKVTFRFKKDDDYRLIPVNGVWGGVTPRGDIKVDFFHESQSLPEEITHTVTLDGKLTNEREHLPPLTVQRTILVGMVLTVEQAESIGRWLQEKAREVRKHQREKGSGDSEHDIPTH